MGGVEVQTHQRLVALGQRDRLEHRIDDSLRRVPQIDVLAGDDAPAGTMNLAVLVDHPPRGRHAIHFALARADAVERLQPAERFFHGGPEAVRHPVVEREVRARGRILRLHQELVGVVVGDRRGMLVDRVYRNPRGLDPGALGDLLAEQVVGRIAQRTPIDRAEDVPLSTVFEHDALRQQGMLDLLQRFVHRRIGQEAQRRSQIALERGRAKFGGLRG